MPTHTTKTFKKILRTLGFIAREPIFIGGEDFTGNKQCVNPSVSMTRAGKNLGKLCFFTPQGDAMSLETGFGKTFQGQLRQFSKTIFLKAKKMHKKFKGSSFFHLQTPPHKTTLNSPTSKLIVAALFLGVLLFPSDLWAATDDVLKEEVGKIEKLFTGGYMRLGLLGVCGFAAIYGVVKQSGWTFASGILGCVFAYFMKDWILKTFAMVI